MATGTKPGSFPYLAESQQEQERLRELQESQAYLREALMNRQQLFDPTLLAIARGFLMPTKSGGFGESLANVAGMVGPVQEAEEKRGLEMAQIRRELAMQDYLAAQQAETYRQMATQPSILDVMSGRVGPLAAGRAAVAPAEGAGPTPGRPAAQVSAQAPAGAPAEATEARPAVSPAMQALGLIESQLNSPRPEIAKKGEQNLKIWENATKDRYKVENRVVYDLLNVDASGAPRIVADLGEQKPFEITFKGQGRSVPATAAQVEEYRKAQERGPQAEEEAFNRLFKGLRTGIEAMPFGGKLEEFRITIPDPSGSGKLVSLSGQADPRSIALIKEEEARAFDKTGDFSRLMSLYQRATGQGIYQKPSKPEKTSAISPQAAPQTEAERNRQDILRKEVDKSSQAYADALAAGDTENARRLEGDLKALRREVLSSQKMPLGIEIDEELSRLPVADQNKILADRISKSEKEAQDQMSIIRQLGPSQIEESNRRLKEIRNLAIDHPRVWNLMNQKGALMAALAAANEGVRVGPYTISAPVRTFLEKLKLSPEEQDIARRGAMLLDEEFFFRSVGKKSVLGPQISNADAVLMKSPMARPEDSARLITYWTTHGLLTNRQAEDIYKRAVEMPGTRSPKLFIGRDIPEVMKSYTPLFERIQQDFVSGRR